MPVTVKQVLSDILLLWGIEATGSSPVSIRDRAVMDLNGAVQLIWSQAKDRDYFTRKTLTETFTIGQSNATLDQEVQNVLGSVRLSSGKAPLRPLTSRNEYDRYGIIYLGQTSPTVAGGTPEACFVERLNQDDEDNVSVILHIVPAPTISTDILIDVALECPHYEWEDYCDETPLQIPHKYIESVLLPICRYRAMSFHYFTKKEIAPALERDFKIAMSVLGMLDPQIKETETAKEAA